ncbi:hypothetical protein GCM10010123_02250 [Pilimelia anulata]|uniref:Uncharacterized protein n=1 Tax=Pilimelia anulata TaxID=53371 RepID=A0A8J3B1B7_9ACTN|nr:hypothetical protein [Pilimelia anulata]GGJ75866.1 hypothetical protein GCM10010123_02250 [Pilimelia anulata]
MSPPIMACRTCGVVLNVLTDPAGSTDYLHPARLGGYSHEPDPAPAAEVTDVDWRCDLCSDPRPMWERATLDQVAAILTGDGQELVQQFGDKWLACITCDQFLNTRDTSGLLDHVAATMPFDDPVSVRALAAIQTAVVAGLTHERTLVTDVPWPPGPPAAVGLPKARDALTRLLASDAGIPPLPQAARPVVTAGVGQCGLWWVDGEFTSLASHAAIALPDTALTSELLPAAHGLLVWAAAIDSRSTVAASWTSTERDGWKVVFYRSVGTGLDPKPLQQVREQIGWLVPTSHHHADTNTPVGAADGPMAVLTVTLLLIAQRAAEQAPAPLDKKVRRAHARAGRPAPEVRIVRVAGTRRPDGPPVPSQRGVGAAVSVRRWVSGFWRQQPYGPRRALRRPVYIHPYLRGPGDAPIAATTTVRVLHTPTPPPPPRR